MGFQNSKRKVFYLALNPRGQAERWDEFVKLTWDQSNRGFLLQITKCPLEATMFTSKGGAVDIMNQYRMIGKYDVSIRSCVRLDTAIVVGS